jgi:hypothetical protein
MRHLQEKGVLDDPRPSLPPGELKERFDRRDKPFDEGLPQR